MKRNRFLTKRLAANVRHHFHEINPNDTVITEDFNDEVMEAELKDVIKIRDTSKYFIYGKKNNEPYKNEESYFKDLKNSHFKNKRADLTILEFDENENETFAHVIEMKSKLDLKNFKTARAQLLNSLLDVEIISLISSNGAFSIEPSFHLICNKEEIIEDNFLNKVSRVSATARLRRSDGKVAEPDVLATQEYSNNRIITDMDLEDYEDREKYRGLDNPSCRVVQFKVHVI
ncbi:hypothetical protein [Salinicoccus sp. Marseille-QA3877]